MACMACHVCFFWLTPLILGTPIPFCPRLNRYGHARHFIINRSPRSLSWAGESLVQDYLAQSHLKNIFVFDTMVLARFLLTLCLTLSLTLANNDHDHDRDHDHDHGHCPPVTRTPTPTPSVQCIVGGSPCPTGSQCTQTMTCHGLCLSVFTPPPVVPCTVGASTGCSIGSTCTPTMSCPPVGGGSCGGACISVPTSTSLAPCTMGGACPTGSTCTPTMACSTPAACGGLCIATPTNLPSIPCILGAFNACPTGQTCTQTETCSGLCLATPVPTLTPRYF